MRSKPCSRGHARRPGLKLPKRPGLKSSPGRLHFRKVASARSRAKPTDPWRRRGTDPSRTRLSPNVPFRFQTSCGPSFSGHGYATQRAANTSRPRSDRFWLLELRVSRTFLDQLRPQLLRPWIQSSARGSDGGPRRFTQVLPNEHPLPVVWRTKRRMGILDVLDLRDVASVDGFDPVPVNEPDSGSKPPFPHLRELPAAFVLEAPQEEPQMQGRP